MKSFDRNCEEFSTLGVTTLQNALAESKANDAREQFETADFDHIQQRRRGYFKRALPSSPLLPEVNEIYSADFWRSQFLEGGDLLKNLYEKDIKPVIELVSGQNLSAIELRAYKMTAGGHFRAHIDDY